MNDAFDVSRRSQNTGSEGLYTEQDVHRPKRVQLHFVARLPGGRWTGLPATCTGQGTQQAECWIETGAFRTENEVAVGAEAECGSVATGSSVLAPPGGDLYNAALDGVPNPPDTTEAEQAALDARPETPTDADGDGTIEGDTDAPSCDGSPNRGHRSTYSDLDPKPPAEESGAARAEAEVRCRGYLGNGVTARLEVCLQKRDVKVGSNGRYDWHNQGRCRVRRLGEPEELRFRSLSKYQRCIDSRYRDYRTRAVLIVLNRYTNVAVKKKHSLVRTLSCRT